MVATEKQTFGELLRIAREQAGLSHSDVASKLNLRVSLVKDLEDGIIDPNIPEVFTRGYLKSYAELLKIDPTVVLKIYDDFVGNTETRKKIQKDEAKQFKAQKKKRVFLTITILGLFVAIIAFAILGLVLWSKYSDPAPLIDGPLPFAENTDENLTLTIEESPSSSYEIDKTDEERLEEFDQLQQQVKSEMEEKKQKLNDQSQSKVAKNQESSPNTANSVEASIAVPNQNVASALISSEEKQYKKDELDTEHQKVADLTKYQSLIPEPALDLSRSTAEIEEQKRSPNQYLIEINTSPNYNIHIEFKGDCWLDLKSGMNDRRVVARIFKDGRILDYNLINMPLKFKIGAPQNVSLLTINDNKIDLSSAVPNKPFNLEVSTK